MVQPGESRFFQPDIVPGDISDPQSLNRYAYVRDNPVRYADPSGEQFNEKADWGGGAAGLAAIGAAVGASSGASLRNRTQRNTTTANSRSVVKAAQTYVANKTAAAGKKIIQSAKTVAAAAYTAAKTIAKDRSEKRSTYESLNAPTIRKRKVDTFPWSNVEKARNGGFSSRDVSLNGNGSDGACTVKPFLGTAAVADKPVLHVFPGQRAEENSVKVSANTASHPNGVYEKVNYHGKKDNAIKSKAPHNGQAALDNSIPIGTTTTRRVGISDGEFVVLDETSSGVFHGHVRSWNKLSDKMRTALRKAGMVNKKGKIVQ